MSAFTVGDRVTVTDLRTGTTHPGVVAEVPDANYVHVKYDSGRLVRVGTGFVAKVGK